MNKLIHYIALCCILFTACSKEDAAQNSPVSPDDEGVEVILNLVPQAIQAPAPTTKSSAGNSNPNVLASSREGAMSLELLAGQPDATTRAGEVDESAIDNLWILQFNGTGNDATLVKKIYKTDLPNNPNLRFIPGNSQRIVVLANSFNPTLDNTLTKYSDLSTLINETNTTIDGFIPMNGTITTDIAANSESIQKFIVPLKRNVAKITLKVKLADRYPTTGTWTAQMCSIAPDYWFPSSGTEIFPTITGDNTSAYKDLTAKNFTFNTSASVDDGYTTLIWFVPVNRRGTVDNTTGITRKTNAPTGATYIKLLYESDNGIYQFKRTYYIHLGANFTTDYNVCGNTHYTYKVTLYPEGDGDSRFDEINVATIAEYIGMFGGKLKETEPNSGIWQFSKQLWMQPTDAATNISYSSTQANDDYNGKSNTYNQKSSDPFKICFEKNEGYSSINSTTDPNYHWYLPAHRQLIGIWIAHESFGNNKLTQYYWSSTMSSSLPWWTDFSVGTTQDTFLANNVAVRCVIESENLTLPNAE